MHKKISIRIIIWIVLIISAYSGYSQSLKWIDGYSIGPTIGIRFSPVKTTPYYIGIMGGISIQHPKKRLGMNLRLNYAFPIKTIVDSASITPSIYYFYFEFTYRMFYIKENPFRISLGVGKPSYKINPYYGCPYCFHDNIHLSIQQQISKINFELKLTFPVGTYYFGWFLPRSDLAFFNLGINYTFDLKRKKRIKD